MHRFYFFCHFILLSLLLAGCLSFKPNPDYYHYYRLSNFAHSKVPSAYSTTEFICLKTLEIPFYLNQPRLPLALDDQRFVYDEYNRWAEDIKGNISALLCHNLSDRLALPVMPPFPSVKVSPLYQLHVRITELCPSQTGKTCLTACWVITDPKGNVLAYRTHDYAVTISGPITPLACVQSMKKVLEQLIHSLADDIKPLVQTTRTSVFISKPEKGSS